MTATRPPTTETMMTTVSSVGGLSGEEKKIIIVRAVFILANREACAQSKSLIMVVGWDITSKIMIVYLFVFLKIKRKYPI